LHFLVALTADDVNHGKNDDPYAIDKMPVPREHLDMLGVRPGHVSAQAQDENQHEQDQTHDHVTGVQTHQGVKGRAKKIGADREMISKDQLVPFQSRGTQKHHREEDCDQPPELKSSTISLSKGSLSQHDRETTG
jgi:hypothetical protein